MKRPNLTLGPWKLDARLNSPLTLSGAGKHLATFHRDGNTTAQVHPVAGETEANARAIAALPALLEALETIKQAADDSCLSAVELRTVAAHLSERSLRLAGYEF